MSTRNRSKPLGSLEQRLLASAKVARDKAASMPAGATRANLLRRAELAERTAAVARWVTTSQQPMPE